MKKGLKITVCMATYNGERYLLRQIESILPQLEKSDEIIIVDDASKDNTLSIIAEFADTRIRLIQNSTNLGVIKSFEISIQHAKGDLIFLCDQDDIWFENKVNRVISAFDEEDIDILVHDGIIIDNNYQVLHQSITEKRLKWGPGVLRNILQNNYHGCFMAFRSNVAQSVLPIPSHIDMHDMWIGIYGEMLGFKAKFISDKLMYYVRHGGNISNFKRRSIFKVLIARTLLIFNLIIRYLTFNRTNNLY